MDISPRMSLEPSVSVNVVDLPQASFTATVLRARDTDTVTVAPRMFVSGVVQSNSTTNSVGSNLRLRREYAPGSELFVVYADDYDTESSSQATTLRNRAFVIKVSRLFRP
jgi:hypothetical protein